MKLVFADDNQRNHLLPFVFTRPVSELRSGILTIREKWEKILDIAPGTSTYITEPYLNLKYAAPEGEHDFLVINGALLPDEEVIAAVKKLNPGESLVNSNIVLAARFNGNASALKILFNETKQGNKLSYPGKALLIRRVYDLFRLNDITLRFDFNLLTKNRKSAVVSSTNQVRNPDMLFIEEGAKVENSIINAESGPVYIAAGAEIMEGCMIRGPFALGENAVMKMGSKVYGATTIGTGCKAGGEISNSIMYANSNKAHDGFLGNSVIGEWCNLGADTNNSNLKNNYSEVRIWNYALNDYEGTGLQFCGLFMGDHSKCAINTSFNTGTVTGMGANIFVHGFPPKHIPSFSWGGDAEAGQFMLEKFLALAETVMQRRNIPLTAADRSILSHIYMMRLHPQAED